MKRFVTSSLSVILAIGLWSCSTHHVHVRVVTSDGKSTEKEVRLRGRNPLTFKMAKSALADVDSIYVTPDFAHAEAGEEGFFLNSMGFMTYFLKDRPDTSTWISRRHPLKLQGIKTPAGCYLAIFDSYRFHIRSRVDVKGGHYSNTLIYLLGGVPANEDLRLSFYRLEGKDTTYSGMGRLYRKLFVDGKLPTLKEKASARPLLKYAVDNPEVRIRMGWKPVPTPVVDQTPENEPPMRVKVTFDRVCDIVDALKAEGVDKAQLTLVGWNLKGHDGRFPTVFPPEPALGGAERLKHLIPYAQDNGFQIVPHICTGDSYRVSEDFDEADVAKKADGSLDTRAIYSSGRMYQLCPKVSYEKFVQPINDSLRAYGFRGLEYNDVYSIIPPVTCHDPNHPLTSEQAAEYDRLILQDGADKIGGIASEGGFDHVASVLDFCLYASMEGLTALGFRKNRDAYVPIWHIIYNGYIYSCPFSQSVNYPVKDPGYAMKMQEYGGHPTFYFYSAHRDDSKNWIGTHTQDLRCGTGQELDAAVSAIRTGAEYLKQYGYIQYLTFEDHKEIAPGVFRSLFSDGTCTYCNYTDRPFYIQDTTCVPSQSWRIIPGTKDIKVSVKDCYLPYVPDTLWVNLERGERTVLSGPMVPPAKGLYLMNGFQVFKNADNRFVFGRENFPDGEYMVAWRICGGVKVLQEARKIPRTYRRKPLYARITIRHDRNIRFYYAEEPHAHLDAAGWDSFSGVMDANVVKHRGTEGSKGVWMAALKGPGPEGQLAKDRLKPMVHELVAAIPNLDGHRYSCQGLAIQGDTAIIIRDKGWCEIYDLKAQKSLSFYKLEGNDSHCNNATFGQVRGTSFPLLYISEDNGGHACLVTDIGMDGSRIVQRIYYDTDGSDYPGPFDWMVDRDNGYLYTYGGTRWQKRWIKRFPLPRADIPEVHLRPEDALQTIYYDEVGIGQGGFVKDGRIYLSAGYPPYYCKLHVYDAKSGTQLLRQDIRDLRYEPEGMDVSDGYLYMVFWCGDEGTRIYRFIIE